MQALELRIPPVALFILCAAAMWAISTRLPGLNIPLPGAMVAAIIVGTAGMGIAVAGVVAFRRHSTTVDPTKPGKATTIVTGGVYRYTRNPMYLGLVVILVGWGVYLENAATLLVVPAFVAYMGRFQIRPEERILLEIFGDEFAAYMSQVRRWI